MKEDKTIKELLGQKSVLSEDEWDQLMLGIMNVTEENPEEGLSLYKAAYKKVQTWDQLSMIANDVSIILHDIEWGKALCHEAAEKAEDAIDHAVIGGIVADIDGLNDSELGKELFNKALAKAETAIQYCIIAEIVSHPDGLYDKTWAKEVFQIALDKAETDEMTASIKDSMDECL